MGNPPKNNYWNMGLFFSKHGLVMFVTHITLLRVAILANILGQIDFGTILDGKK